jgi:cholesterol oxidase
VLKPDSNVARPQTEFSCTRQGRFVADVESVWYGDPSAWELELISDKMERVDAVVIGSGFGGAVSAARLAQAGLSVVILERGRLYPPGSFPRSPHTMARNWWDPSKGLFGLFEAWTFRTLGALVASGVGGGSLIYANVLLRKDEKWFVENGADGEDWPVSRQDLEPHYDRVERGLKPQCYPFDVAPYNATPKTHLMKEAAEGLNLNWLLPKLAVTFGNSDETPVPGEPIREPYPNLHRRTRLTCRLCGECDIGCNYGSKNTMDYTFLTEAVRDGADLRALSDVREIAPLESGGYRVSYIQHDLASEGSPQDINSIPRQTLEAPIVVLAAGTLGSTSLMLRNSKNFPGMSPALGTRFSGNGDLLAFAARCRDTRDVSRRLRLVDPTFGPVITSTIRLPDALDGNEGGHGRGAYIQDGGQPNFASWVAEGANLPGGMWRMMAFGYRYIRHRLGITRNSSLSHDISRAFSAGELTSSSLTMLGMGRDVAGGRMSLDGGMLTVDWPRRDSLPFLNNLNEKMKAIAHFHGARYIPNPLSFLGRTVTVHPLGGCPMGRDVKQGVVDSHGQVFGYPGLIIADGSVMPGPVGANPSLTIAALADRFSGHAIETRPGRIKSTSADAQQAPRQSAI